MKAIQHPYAGNIQSEQERSTVFHRFFKWCAVQEEDRLLWLGFIIGGHGCIFTPLTLLLIMAAGNSFILWPFAIAAMTMTLIPNLAAMPTKVTIPLFFLSLLIDTAIVINCLVAIVAAGVTA